MNFARDIRRQLDGECVEWKWGIRLFHTLHLEGVFTCNIQRQLQGESTGWVVWWRGAEIKD